MTARDKWEGLFREKPELAGARAGTLLSMAVFARHAMANPEVYLACEIDEAQETIAGTASDLALAREVIADPEKHVPFVVDLAREFIGLAEKD
jgi:hypothetical protein